MFHSLICSVVLETLIHPWAVGGWCGRRDGKGGLVAKKMGQNARNPDLIFLASLFCVAAVMTIVTGKYTAVTVLKVLITPGKTSISSYCQRIPASRIHQIFYFRKASVVAKKLMQMNR